MEQTNKDVFDEVDTIDGTPIPVQPSENISATPVTAPKKAKTLAELNAEAKAAVVPTPAFEFGDAAEEEHLRIQLDEADKANVFEIASVEFLKPRLQDENGSFIPPSPFNPEKPDQIGYKAKVKVRYVGTDYVSYLPGLRWYPKVDNGKNVLSPWIVTELTADDLKNPMASTIGKVFYRYSQFVKNDKLTTKAFKEGLVGKKVKLEQYSSKYKGRMGYRIDIVEFVA